ncbi:hypothetical protein C8R44DRAFT_733380 [Mycena epipterygia]|nr:hypothetical protein C8R44DRAFT_733380 [Mycena epipterygia]
MEDGAVQSEWRGGGGDKGMQGKGQQGDKGRRRERWDASEGVWKMREKMIEAQEDDKQHRRVIVVSMMWRDEGKGPRRGQPTGQQSMYSVLCRRGMGDRLHQRWVTGCTEDGSGGSLPSQTIKFFFGWWKNLFNGLILVVHQKPQFSTEAQWDRGLGWWAGGDVFGLKNRSPDENNS